MDQLNDTTFIGQIAIALFLAIVFLQSGIDKVMDWKGNSEWLNGHFAKSPLAAVVTPMLVTVTVVELATGLLALCGLYCIVFCDDNSCILYAVTLSLIAYLMLIFGQRIAKDYAGAQTIAIYFGVSLIALSLF